MLTIRCSIFQTALLFMTMIISTATFAEKSDLAIKRTLSMEWESMADVVGYELEVTRVLKSGSRRKPLFFKTKQAQWKGTVNAGRYEVRLRSSDDRGVYGEWSPPIEVWARLPQPQIVTPLADSEIKSTQSEADQIKLEWKNVNGAAGYWLEVKTEVGEPIFEGVAKDNKFEVNAKVAQKLNWRVATIMPEEEKPPLEDVPISSFTILGAELDTPSIIRPDSKFVTDLEWSKPDRAESYSYELYRRTVKNWVRIETQNNVAANKIALNPEYPGGQMRLKVSASGKLRLPSKQAVMDFNVYEGSRTPAAIEEAKLREAIDRARDHLIIGSYLISSISYSGRNREAGRAAVFDALTGTGRLGYAYIPNKSKWGYLFMADLSGTLIQQKNYLFYSAEAQAVWRTYIRGTTQLRLYGGGYLRQLPEAVKLANSDIKVNDVSALGPHIGTQLWYPITYKVGLQANAQVLFSMVGLKTPNGNDIVPSMSYQVGMLGSYKLRENMTGMLGYAYRLDTLNYKSKPFDGTDLSNFAKAGDVNEVSIEGHYLNLFFEWGF